MNWKTPTILCASAGAALLAAGMRERLWAQQSTTPPVTVSQAPQTGPVQIQPAPGMTPGVSTATLPSGPGAVSTILPPAPGTAGAGIAPRAATVSQPHSVTLSSEYARQVYIYPKSETVDPVQPPSSLGATSGEENLTVAGIIMDSHDPSMSRAMIRAKGFEKTRYAVRAGDKIEQYKVVEINPTSVVMAVPVLGGTRTVVLERARDRALGRGDEIGVGVQRRQTVVTEVGTPNSKGAADSTAAQTPVIRRQ